MSVTQHRTPTKGAGSAAGIKRTNDSSSSNESEIESAVHLSEEMKKNKNKKVSPVSKNKKQEKTNGAAVSDSCRPDSSSSGRKRKTHSKFYSFLF